MEIPESLPPLRPTAQGRDGSQSGLAHGVVVEEAVELLPLLGWGGGGQSRTWTRRGGGCG
jgi:hypothetical protein